MYDSNQYEPYEEPRSPESMDVVQLFVRWKVLMELRRISAQSALLMEVADLELKKHRLTTPPKLN